MEKKSGEVLEKFRNETIGGRSTDNTEDGMELQNLNSNAGDNAERRSDADDYNQSNSASRDDNDEHVNDDPQQESNPLLFENPNVRTVRSLTISITMIRDTLLSSINWGFPTEDSPPQSRCHGYYKKYLFPNMVYIIVLAAAILSYSICKSVFEDGRRKLTDPEISFSLGRMMCLDDTDEPASASSCLSEKEIGNLTEQYRKFCRESLRAILMENCNKSKSDRSRIDIPDLIRIKGADFNNELTKNKNAVEFTMCVRAFEKNPFGDVKVVPIDGIPVTKITDRYDFMYRNYELLRSCGLIPADPFFSTYFRNPRNANVFIMWISVLLFFVSSFFKFLIWVLKTSDLKEIRSITPTAQIRIGDDNRSTQTRSVGGLNQPKGRRSDTTTITTPPEMDSMSDQATSAITNPASLTSPTENQSGTIPSHSSSPTLSGTNPTRSSSTTPRSPIRKSSVV